MLCGCLVGPTVQDAEMQLQRAGRSVDLLEFRWDLFTAADYAAFAELRKRLTLPVLYKAAFPESSPLWEWLCRQQPEFIDVAHPTSRTFLERLRVLAPHTKIILSHHAEQNSLEDFRGRYAEMQQFPADYLKIVSWENAFKMAAWVKERQDPRLMAISAGAEGSWMRVATPLLKMPWSYTWLGTGASLFPGQLSLHEMIETYHYRQLSAATRWFGLIGDPVAQSVSHRTHNRLFQQLKCDALYLKVRVTKAELAAFFTALQVLPFQGLSVTMPLKEEVAPFADVLAPSAQRAGAVNTLQRLGKSWVGHNTDAPAALDLIEQYGSVKGKRLLILGAGGVARAIAAEALHRGAAVCILNRTLERAQKLANSLGVDYGLLSDCVPHDVCVQATPLGMSGKREMAWNPQQLSPDAIVLETVYNLLWTPFAQAAAQRGCRVITGDRLFVAQALKQFQIWLGGDMSAYTDHLQASVSDALANR